MMIKIFVWSPHYHYAMSSYKAVLSCVSVSVRCTWNMLAGYHCQRRDTVQFKVHQQPGAGVRTLPLVNRDPGPPHHSFSLSPHLVTIVFVGANPRREGQKDTETTFCFVSKANIYHSIFTLNKTKSQEPDCYVDLFQIIIFIPQFLTKQSIWVNFSPGDWYLC